MIELAKLAIGGMGITTKLIAAGVILALIGTAYGVWHHTVWERGYDRAIADFAKADKKAVARATAARTVLLDCQSRGLRWDQSTGICERR